MYHPSIGENVQTPELFGILGRLAAPEQRQEATSALARLLGGEALILFAPDPELGVALPAPGLSQVLREAADWRKFLEECTRAGEMSGRVPGPDGRPVEARGCALPDGTAAVLIRPAPRATGPGPLLPLLPLLGALFRAERQIVAGEVRARAAADAIGRASVLTRALQEMRQRLEDALVEAQQARTEARGRAEQAEDLALELSAQAERLQEQAVELETLNEELTTRTEEAERARAIADEANRAKSEFLANMSHELRTPINAVIGYTELLDMGIAGPVTKGQQAQLERIRVSSAHLLSLVNEVLDLAKVESGHMTVEHEHESVAEVVSEAVEMIAPEAASRDLAVENECRDPGVIYVGDRDRVRQILANLLSNAVKFTRPGGRVTLRVRTSHQPEEDAQVIGDGPWVCVMVEDTGIGMGPDQLSRVFQPFVQAESGRTRTHGGAGLGLTISRQLARLMGGDLTVRSEMGRGSCFTLWLPAGSPETGSLDPTIQVGISTTPGPLPGGLVEVGEIVQVQLPAITAAFARRVRSELPVAQVEGMDETEIRNQLPVLLMDLSGVLIRLGRVGGNRAQLREGSSVQRLIAEEHGADRGRRGWTAGSVRQEFDILQEELIGAVRVAMKAFPGADADGGIHLLVHLVEAARRTSLRSYGATVLAAGSTTP